MAYSRRKISCTSQQDSLDPAISFGIAAVLRVISHSDVSGLRLSTEIVNFLCALATPEELVSSFPSGRLRREPKQRLANRVESPNDDDVDWDEDEDTRLTWQDANRHASASFIGLNRESLNKGGDKRAQLVLRTADAETVKTLATSVMKRWLKSYDENGGGWLEKNVAALTTLFDLSPAEAETTKLAIAVNNLLGQSGAVMEGATEIFNSRCQRKLAMMILARAIDFPVTEMADVLNPEGAMRSSGLFEHVMLQGFDIDDVLQLSLLGQLFASESFENEREIRTRVLKPLSLAEDESLVFTHVKKEKEELGRMLTGAIESGESGINVLLYGQAGTGKTEFVRSLVRELGIDCYEVGSANCQSGLDASRDYRLSYLRLINKLIKPEERAVILLDEAEDIFDIMSDDSGRAANRRRGSKAWVNNLLENIRIPTIWITNDIRFDAAHLRRFVYLKEFDIPPISVRQQIVRNNTAGLSVSNKTISTLAQNEVLTPAMLSTATRFARLARLGKDEVDDSILRHAAATQRAIGVVPTGTLVSSDTGFDPRFTNMDAAVSIEDLVNGLRRTGRASLLFSGPPGTGKTQLAGHLGRLLDREVIYRTGSDLLNMYVGGTEQRIANLFRSCDPQRELIFLDEAEGLLGGRSKAIRSWEITQVNEFLRQIEQFSGIFIAATNHLENLDAALMRRFAFRFEFKPLTVAQRCDMFVTLSGIALDSQSPFFSDIARLAGLTAGDFANVFRRLKMIGGEGEAGNWLRELQAEQLAKGGCTTRSIGFIP